MMPPEDHKVSHNWRFAGWTIPNQGDKSPLELSYKDEK